MTNHLLTLIVLAALVGTFASAPVPEPLPRSVASRATTDPAVVSRANADSTALEAHPSPIPLMRNALTLPKTEISPDVPVPEAKMQAQDDLDIGAVRAAIEADGYKGVNVLGKAGNGTWRAKAYRGQTEVQLTVDRTGTVSVD